MLKWTRKLQEKKNQSKRNKSRKKQAGAVPPSTLGDLSTSLDDNIKLLDDLFDTVDTMLSRRFRNAGDSAASFCIYYSDGVTDAMMINEHAIKPLILSKELRAGPGLFEQIKSQIVLMNDIQETTDIQEIVNAITYGDTLLLIDGSDRALILSSKSFTLRSISEPEGEKVLSGPREGFSEGIMTNLSLIRRRLRTHHLKLHFITKGRQSSTSVCVAYLDNIVNKTILSELYRRLETIDMDAVLDSNYLNEHIAEKSVLGLSSTGSTERPDVVVGKLLEGRIAILVDGTPTALTLPYLFIENFQSSEDYYMSPIYASYSRILRIMCFFLTITVPAVFVAVVAFHHDMLPSALMLSIANGRRNVPLPAALECFVMLIVFDILREAGVRMPSHVGQALSIVGALVIGQAAVEAKLVAAPMVIVVAFAGISILMVPRLTVAGLIGRYACLLLATMLGLTGLVVGLSVILIHILNMKTFGIPYLLPTEQLRYQEVKDIFFRAPWPKMFTRISPLSRNATRTKPGPSKPSSGMN